MLLNDFYKIKAFKYEGNQVDVTIKIDKSHDIFNGHFPNNPVTPGVCVIQIIKELTEKALGADLIMEKASNIKFKALINPELNDVLDLKLNLKEDEGKIKVKNTTKFEETIALTLSAVYRKS